MVLNIKRGNSGKYNRRGMKSRENDQQQEDNNSDGCDDTVPLNETAVHQQEVDIDSTWCQLIAFTILTYAKVVLPHVGLVILCIVYVLAGGVLFFLIERSHEVEVRADGLSKIAQAHTEALNNLWDLTLAKEATFDTYRNSALLEIEEMSRVLFKEFEERYISLENIRSNSSSTNEMWTIATAVFFAVTTVTTVGYGNLVPVTVQGRVICTIFGLFGIPLMLVTIADIGSFLGDTLRMLAAKNCSRDILKICCPCKQGSPNNTTDNSADQQVRAENRGDENPPDDGNDEMKGDEQEDPDDVMANLALADEVDVPVSWVLLLIVAYTLLGAFLFPLWEPWSFFESFYFSLITMTTVGFGDYVPTNVSYYVITLLYIVLGLAITTMSVELVAGQYIKKIHYFGRKIQSAKQALKNVSDIMKYSMFLKRRYGLTDKQMEKMAFLPEFFAMQELLMRSGAYTPKDINKILFIDQRTESALTESQRSSVRTLEENMIKKLISESESLNDPVSFSPKSFGSAADRPRSATSSNNNNFYK